MRLWIVAIVVLFVNVPFGYWRANTEKFSRQWFLAIHTPVPLVIVCRIVSGLGWQLMSFPVMVGAFFSGQVLGGKLLTWRKSRMGAEVTSCLLRDLVHRARGANQGADDRA